MRVNSIKSISGPASLNINAKNGRRRKRGKTGKGGHPPKGRRGGRTETVSTFHQRDIKKKEQRLRVLG